MRAASSATLLLALLIRPAASPAAGEAPLRFGAVTVYNPRVMYVKYQPLVDDLGRRTRRPWELVLVPSWKQAVRDLCAGRLTMALLSPFTYVRARAACPVRPVVRLRTGGRATYRGLILVRIDSPIRSLKDLKGHKFGLGAPMSTAASIVARAMTEEAGLSLGRDVICRHYAQQEQAALAVLMGEVDACAVRDLVGEKFVARQALRVLARSEEIPSFPLVLSPAAGEPLRAELARALAFAPGQDPAREALMKSWDEELAGGFVPAVDGDYDSVRRLAVRVFGPSALTLPESALECPSAP